MKTSVLNHLAISDNGLGSALKLCRRNYQTPASFAKTALPVL